MCKYYLRVQTCYQIAKHSNKDYSELMAYVSAVKGMGSKASGGLKKEVPFAMFAVALGVVFGGIGAKMAFCLL